jgi:hypothetical protein
MLHFRNWSDPYLVKPNDFKPDMKDVFREIFELTAKAKVKTCIDLIDSFLLK